MCVLLPVRPLPHAACTPCNLYTTATQHPPMTPTNPPNHPQYSAMWSFIAQTKRNRADALCLDNEYACSNGECIIREAVCDGHNDCVGSDDEIDCVCAKNEVRFQIDFESTRTIESLYVILLT